MLNEWSKVSYLENQNSNSGIQVPMQGTFHILLKDISILAAYLLIHRDMAYDSPNVGNKKCLFIYKYMGKQFPDF
jgi:hypothetical protein